MLAIAYVETQIKNEKSLIAACIREDSAAQTELFNRYASQMLGVCYRYVQTKPEAEDIMQEGFIKVFDHLKNFRAESGLAAWIRKIMVNTAINHLKTNKKFRLESGLDEISDEQQGGILIDETRDTEFVMQCIRDLPHGYRVVLNLFAIEGYSHKEIGDLLGIGESSSRSQFSRARKLLEKRLQQHQILDKDYVRRSVS